MLHARDAHESQDKPNAERSFSTPARGADQPPSFGRGRQRQGSPTAPHILDFTRCVGISRLVRLSICIGIAHPGTRLFVAATARIHWESKRGVGISSTGSESVLFPIVKPAPRRNTQRVRSMIVAKKAWCLNACSVFIDAPSKSATPLEAGGCAAEELFGLRQFPVAIALA